MKYISCYNTDFSWLFFKLVYRRKKFIIITSSRLLIAVEKDVNQYLNGRKRLLARMQDS